MKITDEKTLEEVRATLLLSAAAGAVIHLKDLEPAKHTRRYRDLDKAEDAIMRVFDNYRLVGQYDLTALGCELFDDGLNDKLADLMSRGVEVGGVDKLVFGT